LLDFLYSFFPFALLNIHIFYFIFQYVFCPSKQCAINALKKAATYSNDMVQQRMIDNYRAAYDSQVMLLREESLSNFNDPNDDPNDKKTYFQRRGCSRCAAMWNIASGIWRGTASGKQLRADAAHMFFSALARVVIFMLWLLLGLPSITTTNLSETNIRAAHDDVTTIEV
jgi:hypothetical protein